MSDFIFTPHKTSPQQHVMWENWPSLMALISHARTVTNRLAHQGFVAQNKPVTVFLLVLDNTQPIPPHIANRKKEPFKSQAFCVPHHPHLWIIIPFKKGQSNLAKLSETGLITTHIFHPHGRSSIAPKKIFPADIRKICPHQNRAKPQDWFFPAMRERLWPEVINRKNAPT